MPYDDDKSAPTADTIDYQKNKSQDANKIRKSPLASYATGREQAGFKPINSGRISPASTASGGSHKIALRGMMNGVVVDANNVNNNLAKSTRNRLKELSQELQQVRTSTDDQGQTERTSTRGTSVGLSPEMLQAQDSSTVPKQTRILSVNWDVREPNEKKKQKVPCYCRCLVFLVAALVVVGAMALYIILRTDPTPPSSSRIKAMPETDVGGFSCDDKVTFGLGENIEIKCSYKPDTKDDDDDGITLTSVLVFPAFAYGNETINIDNKNNTKSDWMLAYNRVTNNMLLSLGRADCRSHGRFEIVLRGRKEDGIDFDIGSDSTFLNVTSTASDIEFQVERQENSTDDLIVNCSVNSGCNQSVLNFFGGDNRHLRGFNFTCLVSYNDYQGYSVVCGGSIPDYIVSQIGGTIGCSQTTSTEEKQVNRTLKDCDIKNNCNYKCDDTIADYYTVDEDRCDIFHRCVTGTAYTTYCSPGTFFSNNACACTHIREEEKRGKCTEEGININENKEEKIRAENCTQGAS